MIYSKFYWFRLQPTHLIFRIHFLNKFLFFKALIIEIAIESYGIYLKHSLNCRKGEICTPIRSVQNNIS